MLDFEAFVFIGVHNWDGRNQGDEVDRSNNVSAHENFEVL